MAKKESKGKPDKRSHVPTPTPAPVGEAEDVSWDVDVMPPPPPNLRLLSQRLSFCPSHGLQLRIKMLFNVQASSAEVLARARVWQSSTHSEGIGMRDKRGGGSCTMHCLAHLREMQHKSSAIALG